jgi:hypothetical protein
MRFIKRNRVRSASALKRKAMLSSLLAMRLLDSVLVAKYYDFKPSGVPFSPEFLGSFSFKFTGKSSKILSGSCVQNRRL